MAHGIRWWELVPWSRCIKRQRLGFDDSDSFFWCQGLERSLFYLGFGLAKSKSVDEYGSWGVDKLEHLFQH